MSGFRNQIKLEPKNIVIQVDAPVPATKVRLRNKKGPRRLNKLRGQQQIPRAQHTRQQKQQSKTLAELDAEMDDYRAHANGARA